MVQCLHSKIAQHLRLVLLAQENSHTTFRRAADFNLFLYRETFQKATFFIFEAVYDAVVKYRRFLNVVQ